MQNLISGAGQVPKADLSEMHEEKWTHGVLFVLKQFSLQVKSLSLQTGSRIVE